jgi:hypothetical protein
MARLEQEAGVALDELRLDDLRHFTQPSGLRVVVPARPADHARPDADGRARSHARRAAGRGAAGQWPLVRRDRTIAAAMLDVLWSVGSYERLVADWASTRRKRSTR